MDINKVKELIKAVSESELTAFEYEEGNIKMSLKKGPVEENNIVTQVKEKIVSGDVKETAHITDTTVKNKQEEKTETDWENIVKSPLVGTVYLSPEEGKEPFVKVGDKVSKGQTLAIVEAMKLMNEIESDFDGVVRKIYVENATTVEYNQPLFAIE